MKVKCEYCDSYIDDTEEKCPNCGAPNSHMTRSANGVPKTIEELKAFCAEKKLPLDKMRFFIGENIKEPCAFGIYRENNGNFVVYKNKSDGSRAVRYRGTDEAYAVNEIYQKMKSEITLRKNSGGTVTREAQDGVKRKSCLSAMKVPLIIFAILAALAFFFGRGPSSGYYNYNDDYYYYNNGDWYIYDDYDGWYETDVDSYLTDNYSDYFESYSYSSDFDVQDFSETEYYQSSYDDSDWEDDDWDDDDWDWDSDSDWDSGYTDWDSDW